MKATAAPILSDLDLDDPFSRFFATSLWLDPSLLKATPPPLPPSHRANIPDPFVLPDLPEDCPALLFQLLTDPTFSALGVFDDLPPLDLPDLPDPKAGTSGTAGASGSLSSGADQVGLGPLR